MTRAMRAVGYELTTAVSDLVDNSLSAGARSIEIDFYWNAADSWIRVVDDGCGMTDEELREAMRPGSAQALAERRKDDLGRFGLGLKTASFSQCRRLTVRSSRDGHDPATRCWDLDYIEEIGEWKLLLDARGPDSEATLGAVDKRSHGTIVLWEKLDRVIDLHSRDPQRRFLERIEEVDRHLRMVFHRFIAAPHNVRITINGQPPILPWDPYLVDHPATIRLPDEIFGQPAVAVRPYVLPHESKLTAEQHHQASGPKGWNAQQGFYVYRAQRLIVSGAWLGLFQQEEHYKLARIQIDIPNSLDHEWQIDIKKASAKLPDRARVELRRIGSRTRQEAKHVYGFRGAVAGRRFRDQLAPVWQQIKRRGASRYQINRGHPLVAQLLSAPPEISSKLRALINVIEETIPINVIRSEMLADTNTDSQSAPFEGRERDLVAAAAILIEAMKAAGKGPEDIERALLTIEPFSHYPELVASLKPQVGGSENGNA